MKCPICNSRMRKGTACECGEYSHIVVGTRGTTELIEIMAGILYFMLMVRAIVIIFTSL